MTHLFLRTSSCSAQDKHPPVTQHPSIFVRASCWICIHLEGAWHSLVQFSCVRLFATPWIAARQASLSIANSQSSPKLMSIDSVMPSSHLILCHPLLLLPPIPRSIRVFSNANTLRLKQNKLNRSSKGDVF